MACTVITTIQTGCSNNLGGIKGLWLWDMVDDKLVASSTFDNATYAWTAYDITQGTLTTPIAFAFNQKGSNYTEETTVSLENGSTFVATTVNLIFSRREALKSKAIKILGEGQRFLGALILDGNGIYWLIENLQLTGTGEGSGTTGGDGSKYSVTLSAENADLAGIVSSADALDLIANGLFV